jgi:hypothetical protein
MWQRSSFCASNACVEARAEGGWILVRDSKQPDREPLAIRPDTWRDIILAPIDRHRVPNPVDPCDGGYEWWGHTVEGITHCLTFTYKEWTAFGDGVRAGEFNPEALTRRVIGSGPVKGSGANGPNMGNGMGPRPPKDQPFGDYRLQWGPRG